MLDFKIPQNFTLSRPKPPTGRKMGHKKKMPTFVDIL